MQLAVSFIALTGAGIFVAIYLSILNGDPGFEVRHVIVVPLGTQGGHYTERTGSVFYAQIEQRVRS